MGIYPTQVSVFMMVLEAANVAPCLYRDGGEGVIILIIEEGNTSCLLCFPVSLILQQLRKSQVNQHTQQKCVYLHTI